MYPENEVQICMSVKTYCKYAGVTMLSILEHTASPVRFHILHDGTLSQENREKLNAIVAAYPAASLEYHVVDMSQLAAKEETYRRLSIGPLFRLRMFDALPRDLKRVIQLDADLVVNLDLAELWNLDLQGNMLAACVDTSTSRKVICEKGLVAYDEYINVGVVLWDVAALQRENIDLYRESNAFFRRVPDVRLPDEEAVNVIFHGRIKHLDERYNYLSIHTKTKHDRLEEKIYHFAADVPRTNGHFMVDRLFEACLRKTPWWTPEFVERVKNADAERKAKRAWLRERIPQASQSWRKRVFWGIGGSIHPFIMDRFDLRPDDVFVDSDQRKWGTQHLGHEVKNPSVLQEALKERPAIFVTIYRYHEVRETLLQMGYRENEDFFDCKALLDEDLLAQFFGERVQPWDAGDSKER